MAEIKQVASAQITITDLNDGKSYVLKIADNFGLGGYFSYDSELNKYTPGWGETGKSLVLTPTFVSLDNATNLFTVTDSGISDVKWFKKKGTYLVVKKVFSQWLDYLLRIYSRLWVYPY